MQNDIVCHEIVRIPSYRSNIFSTQIFQELLIVQYFAQRRIEVSLLRLSRLYSCFWRFALLPLVATHWWESNANKARVALILGVPVAGYLLLQGEAGWHMSSTPW